MTKSFNILSHIHVSISFFKIHVRQWSPKEAKAIVSFLESTNSEQCHGHQQFSENLNCVCNCQHCFLIKESKLGTVL